ncbi:MAG: hypothetical protein ACREMQ_19675 [Longimicrobiales bacterium]
MKEMNDRPARGTPSRLNIGIDGQAEPAMGKLVSGNSFALTGVRATRGRLIGPEDDVPGTDPVA